MAGINWNDIKHSSGDETPEPLPWGINTIGSPYHPDCHAGLPDGRYVHAVCEPHDMGRFRAAWWVLTGRAYAFLWPKAGELEGIWQRINPPVLRTSPRPFVPQADSRGPVPNGDRGSAA